MRLVLAMIGAVTGCVEGPDLGTDRSAIVGGAISPQDRATVGLVSGDAVFCSGVLVEPTIVLTAAHCLPPNGPHALADIAVFFGVDVSQGGTRIAIASALAHPDWRQDAVDNDIGIVALAEASPVDPLAIATNVADLVAPGDQLRAVGYGVSQPQGKDPGIKRAGLVIVDGIDASTVRLRADGTATCSGDSGGPLLVGDVVVGLNSRSNCTTAALAERIDAHRDFIAAFATGRDPDPSPGAAIGGCASTRADGLAVVALVMASCRRGSLRRRGARSRCSGSGPAPA